MSGPVVAPSAAGLRPGLCSVTFRQLSIEAVVDLAADAGIEGIEWGGDVHVDRPAAARRAAQRCADAGIDCPSYGSYLRAGAVDPTEAARAFELAAELGAPNVRVWCDWTGADVTPERWRSIVADVEDLAARGAAAGLAVSLEMHAFTITERAAQAVRLIGEVARPNLFSYWQPIEGLGADRWLDELTTVLPELSHLHVFHWQDFEHRHPLVTGDAYWPEVLRRVSGASADRWSLRGSSRFAFLEFVEGDDGDRFRADAATLRSWLAPDHR